MSGSLIDGLLISGSLASGHLINPLNPSAADATPHEEDGGGVGWHWGLERPASEDAGTKAHTGYGPHVRESGTRRRAAPSDGAEMSACL